MIALYEDLTGIRGWLVKIALVISFIPGLVFIFYSFLVSIEGPNPFLLAALFMAGAPTVIIGIWTNFFADNKIKRKLIIAGLLILFQIALLPILGVVKDIKLNFVSKTLHSFRGLRQSSHIKEDKTILFFISGMIDNCHGIAYSRTGREAIKNECGQLVKWKKLKHNWFEWATT